MFAAFDNRQEVISRELAELAREACRTIGKKNLRFAETTWVE
jgi:hypothetical protein